MPFCGTASCGMIYRGKLACEKSLSQEIVVISGELLSREICCAWFCSGCPGALSDSSDSLLDA